MRPACSCAGLGLTPGEATRCRATRWCRFAAGARHGLLPEYRPSPALQSSLAQASFHMLSLGGDGL
eukprot:7194603-Lingulodinium_polyedra.AAC.1